MSLSASARRCAESRGASRCYGHVRRFARRVGGQLRVPLQMFIQDHAPEPQPWATRQRNIALYPRVKFAGLLTGDHRLPATSPPRANRNSIVLPRLTAGCLCIWVLTATVKARLSDRLNHRHRLSSPVPHPSLQDSGRGHPQHPAKGSRDPEASGFGLGSGDL